MVLSERERRKKGGESKLLSTIYGVPSIGIRWANNESSSHRRGLRVGTESARFRRGPNEEFGKSKVSGLGSVHEAS